MLYVYINTTNRNIKRKNRIINYEILWKIWMHSLYVVSPRELHKIKEFIL